MPTSSNIPFPSPSKIKQSTTNQNVDSVASAAGNNNVLLTNRNNIQLSNVNVNRYQSNTESLIPGCQLAYNPLISKLRT